jgi:hypothetical protein
MPTTGETCSRSGIYKGDCCGTRIALSDGERFPPCSNCKKAVTWTLVQAT